MRPRESCWHKHPGIGDSGDETALRAHLNTVAGAPASGTALLHGPPKNAGPETGAPPPDFPVGGSVKLRPGAHIIARSSV